VRDDDTLIRLGRIEEKVDSLHDRLLGRIDDHERRLRRSEYTLWTGAGVFTAVAAYLTKAGLIH
jgi:hypothetical protein